MQWLYNKVGNTFGTNKKQTKQTNVKKIPKDEFGEALLSPDLEYKILLSNFIDELNLEVRIDKGYLDQGIKRNDRYAIKINGDILKFIDQGVVQLDTIKSLNERYNGQNLRDYLQDRDFHKIQYDVIGCYQDPNNNSIFNIDANVNGNNTSSLFALDTGEANYGKPVDFFRHAFFYPHQIGKTIRPNDSHQADNQIDILESNFADLAKPIVGPINKGGKVGKNNSGSHWQTYYKDGSDAVGRYKVIDTFLPHLQLSNATNIVGFQQPAGNGKSCSVFSVINASLFLNRVNASEIAGLNYHWLDEFDVNIRGGKRSGDINSVHQSRLKALSMLQNLGDKILVTGLIKKAKSKGWDVGELEAINQRIDISSKDRLVNGGDLQAMFKMHILLEYGYDVSKHIYTNAAQEQKKEEEKAPLRPNTVTNELTAEEIKKAQAAASDLEEDSPIKIIKSRTRNVREGETLDSYLGVNKGSKSRNIFDFDPNEQDEDNLTAKFATLESEASKSTAKDKKEIQISPLGPFKAYVNMDTNEEAEEMQIQPIGPFKADVSMEANDETDGFYNPLEAPKGEEQGREEESEMQEEAGGEAKAIDAISIKGDKYGKVENAYQAQEDTEWNEEEKEEEKKDAEKDAKEDAEEDAEEDKNTDENKNEDNKAEDKETTEDKEDDAKKAADASDEQAKTLKTAKLKLIDGCSSGKDAKQNLANLCLVAGHNLQEEDFENLKAFEEIKATIAEFKKLENLVKQKQALQAKPIDKQSEEEKKETETLQAKITELEAKHADYKTYLDLKQKLKDLKHKILTPKDAEEKSKLELQITEIKSKEHFKKYNEFNKYTQAKAKLNMLMSQKPSDEMEKMFLMMQAQESKNQRYFQKYDKAERMLFAKQTICSIFNKYCSQVQDGEDDIADFTSKYKAKILADTQNDKSTAYLDLFKIACLQDGTEPNDDTFKIQADGIKDLESNNFAYNLIYNNGKSTLDGLLFKKDLQSLQSPQLKDEAKTFYHNIKSDEVSQARAARSFYGAISTAASFTQSFSETLSSMSDDEKTFKEDIRFMGLEVPQIKPTLSYFTKNAILDAAIAKDDIETTKENIKKLLISCNYKIEYIDNILNAKDDAEKNRIIEELEQSLELKPEVVQEICKAHEAQTVVDDAFLQYNIKGFEINPYAKNILKDKNLAEKYLSHTLTMFDCLGLTKDKSLMDSSIKSHKLQSYLLYASFAILSILMLFGHAEGFTPLTIQLVICALILAAMFFALYKFLQSRFKIVKDKPERYAFIVFAGWGIFAWQIWQSFREIGNTDEFEKNKEEFEKTDPVKAIRFFSQQDTIIAILAILLIVSIAMSLYFIIKDRSNLSVKENVLKNSWSGVIGVLVFVPLIIAVSINPAFFAAGAAIALALGAICFAIYKYYRKQALKKQIADFLQKLKKSITDSEKQIDFTIQNTLSDIGLTNNQAFMIENNLGARQKVTIFDQKDSSLQIKDGDIKHGLLCILQIYKSAGMKYAKNNQNTLNSEDEDANGGNFNLDLSISANFNTKDETKDVLIEELCEKAFGDKHYITNLLQQTRLMCQATPNGRFESAISLLTNADNEHLLNNNIYANLHTISLVSRLADAILSGNKEYSYSLNDLFEPYYNADAATKAQKDNSSLIDKVFGSKITRYNITIIKVLFVASLAIGGASIMGFLPSEVGWTCLALLIFCLLAIIAMSFYRLATTNEAKVATTKAFYNITTKIKETDFQDLNIAKFDNIVEKDAVEEAKKEQKERDKEERQEISGEDDDEDDEDEDNKSKKNSKSHNHASKAYIDSTSNNLSGEVVKIPKVGNKNSRNIDNIDTDIDSEEDNEESGSDEDNNNNDSDERNKAKDDEINAKDDRERFYKEQEEEKRKEQEQEQRKLVSDALNKQYQAKIAAKISSDLQHVAQNVNANILQSNANTDKELKSFASLEGGDKGYGSAFGGLASFMQENSDGIRQSLALSKNLMDETAIEKAAKKEIVDSAVHVAGHKPNRQVDLLDDADAEEIISDLNDKLQKVDGLNIEEQEILQNAMEILELLSPDNPLFKDLAKSINDAIAEKFGDKTNSLARQNDIDKPSSRLLG